MNWDYIAGFFDGEGHTRVDFHRNGSLKAVWTVYQKDKLVLEEIQMFLEEKGFHTRVYPFNSQWCHAWGLCVYRIEEVESLLRILLPRVIVKREQALAVIQKIENRSRRGEKKRIVTFTRKELVSLKKKFGNSEIARMQGVSPAAIRYWCLKYGI